MTTIERLRELSNDMSGWRENKPPCGCASCEVRRAFPYLLDVVEAAKWYHRTLDDELDAIRLETLPQERCRNRERKLIRAGYAAGRAELMAVLRELVACNDDITAPTIEWAKRMIAAWAAARKAIGETE